MNSPRYTPGRYYSMMERRYIWCVYDTDGYTPEKGLPIVMRGTAKECDAWRKRMNREHAQQAKQEPRP